MSTYYASYSGSSGGAGTKISPWNLTRAGQVVGGTPAAGDTVRIQKGTYAQTWTVAVSGASGNPVTYLANWDGESEGDVIIDGARSAVTGSSAAARETGSWALANGTGILSYSAGQYVTGAPAGNSGTGAAACVYQMDVGSATVYGVFCDDFITVPGATHMTPGSDNHWFVSLWKMAVGAYQANPYARLHDWEAHDQGNAYDHGYKTHDWKGQWAQRGTTLQARFWDSGTGGTNPNNRVTPGVFIGVRRRGIDIAGQQWLVFDGGANDRFKVYRWQDAVVCDGCPHVTFRGVEVRWTSYGGFSFWNASHYGVVDSCKVLGGGMMGGHDGVCLSVGPGSSNALITESEFAYGAHHCVGFSGASNTTVRNCWMHHTPHGMVIMYRSGTVCDNNLIEGCRIEDCGYIDTVPLHKVEHSGIHMGDVTNSVIRRNRFVRTGHGIDLREAYDNGVSSSNAGWVNCRIHNNNFDLTEGGAIWCNDDDAAQTGHTHGNVVANNIFMRGLGSFLPVNDAHFGSSANSGWNNKYLNNCFYNPVFGSGAQTRFYSFYDYSGSLTPDEADGDTGSAPSWITSNWDGNVVGNPALTAPDSGDYSETAGSTVTINHGTETGLLGRPGDQPAVGTIDIGYYEYGGGGTANVKPVAVITETAAKTTNPTTGAVTIDLDGSTSTDSDGTIAAYDWDWDDGSTHGTAANPDSKPYTGYRSYSVKLRVTDNDGAVSDPATYTFTVSNPASTTARVVYDPALVTATSSISGYGPAKIGDRSTYSAHLDGGTRDATGYWVADPDNGAVYPHMVKIDLTGAAGVYKRADRIRFTPHRWQVGRTYEYQLFVSTEDLTLTSGLWVPFTSIGTSQASATGDTAYEWTDTGTVGAVDARFVLVKLISNSNGNQYGGLWEVEVYGTDPDSGTPGAAYTISAATDEDGQAAGSRWGPAKAVDNHVPETFDPFGAWWVALVDDLGAPKSKWLQLDLGSSKQVSHVDIAFGYPTRRAYSYSLEGSTNGTSWTNLLADAATSHTSGGGQWTTEKFPTTSIRYVRLTVLSCEAGAVHVCKIWEVRLFAT